MKKLIALILAMLLVFMLPACSNSVSTTTENDANTEQQAQSTAAETDKEETTTIRFVHFRSEDSQIYQTINKMFEETYPDIKIEMDVESADQTEYYAVLKTKLQGNADAVDVYAIHVGPRLQEFAAAGYAMDLTDTAASAYYYEDFLETARIGDAIYGLPQAYNSYVIFYNKDIFAKYGLEVPSTWDEMKAVCNTLSENGEGTIASGFGENWVFDLQIDGLLSSYYDGDPYVLEKLESGALQWTDSGVVNAYTDLQKMGQDGFFMNGSTGTSYEASIALFTQGKAAMLNTGSWSVGGVLEANQEFNMGFFILPNSQNDYYLIQDVGQSLAVNPNSTKQAAAMQYVAFLSSPEIAQLYTDATMQTSTVMNVVSESAENNALNALIDEFPAVRSASAFVTNPEFADLYLEIAARAFNGEDIASLMAEAQSITNDLLAG